MKTAKATQNDIQRWLSVPELHARCMDQEAKMGKEAFRWLEKKIANERFFRYPLFDPPQQVSDEARKLLSNPGIRWGFLLQLLRNQTASSLRHRIATWLYQENFEPEDVLGSEFSEYRRKALRGTKGRLSLTDVRYANIVELWEPYFAWLLWARSQGQDLQRLGFEESAIQSARKKRSSVAAICEYVSYRLGVGPPAIANAYSRVFSTAHRRKPPSSGQCPT